MIKGEPTAGGWASPQSPMGAGMAAPATGPISTPLHGGPSMTVNQSMQNAPQTPGGGWASPDNSGGGSAAMAPPPINPVAQNYYAQGFQNRLRALVMPTAPRMNAPYSSSTGYVPTFRPQNAY